MKKTIALLCSLSLLASVPVYGADLSTWAKSDYEIISKSGILTKEILSANLGTPITREEVATMMVNFLSAVSDEKIEPKENTFTDTDNPYVAKAYSAGIVSGKSAEIFDPEGKVTRQEFAKMLKNTFDSAQITPNTDADSMKETLKIFSDASEIADWATEALYIALDNGIINGLSQSKLAPGGSATREQAICMVSRAYTKFARKPKSYPVPTLSTNTVNDAGDMDFTWSRISGAKKYFLIIKDENAEVTEAFETKSPKATIYSVDYSSGTYSLTLGVEFTSGQQVFTAPMDFSFSSPIIQTPALPLKELTLAEKEARVFPDGIAFASSDEAKQYMTKVTVPVWRIAADGSKYSREVEIEVNSALAEDVVSIFNEIYNSPEQFPIKAVGGYTWRNSAAGKLSQHSYGTCIDINPNENYYVKPDGTPITGEFWKPYENPYSIPEDGIVVETFKKYGWKWGGNAWGEQYSKDYMHFTYLGK